MTFRNLLSNNFCSEISISLENCTFAKLLKLNNNRFASKIPLKLGLLNRNKEFMVANNLLTGPVPCFQSCFVIKTVTTVMDFVGNF